jgi:hypothetical protein
MKNNFFGKILLGLILVNLTACGAGYKSSWDCPKARGIGCSSINYADEMAMEQILLNTSIRHKKTILINQDILGEHYQEIEIGN